MPISYSKRQRVEGRKQKAEGRRQRVEGRRQKAEGREGRKQKAERAESRGQRGQKAEGREGRRERLTKSGFEFFVESILVPRPCLGMQSRKLWPSENQAVRTFFQANAEQAFKQT